MQRIARCRRRATVLGFATLLVATAALADESTRFTKAETEALAVGKRVWYLRARDNSKISWDFKSDGTVYYASPNTRRNIQLPGTYTVSERGSVCFKWQEDKQIVMQDGCVSFQRDGDRVHVLGGGDPPRTLGEIVD